MKHCLVACAGIVLLGGLFMVTTTLADDADEGRVQIVTRFDGAHAAPGLTGNHVVRDAATWDKLWKALHRTRLPTPPTPEVDFDRHMVIATFAGERRTGGYQTRIAAVVEDEKGLRVEVWNRQPPPDAMVTMALTYPYSMVVAPRHDGQVRWVQVPPPPRR